MNTEDFYKETEPYLWDSDLPQKDEGFYGKDDMKRFAEEYHQAKLKLLGIGGVVGRSEQLGCKFCGADKGLKHGHTPDGELCPMDKTA